MGFSLQCGGQGMGEGRVILTLKTVIQVSNFRGLLPSSIKMWAQPIHCKKMLASSLPQPGCHLPNSCWSGKMKLFPARESFGKWHPDWTGGGKMANLYLQCTWTGWAPRWVSCLSALRAAAWRVASLAAFSSPIWWHRNRLYRMARCRRTCISYARKESSRENADLICRLYRQIF